MQLPDGNFLVRVWVPAGSVHPAPLEQLAAGTSAQDPGGNSNGGVGVKAVAGDRADAIYISSSPWSSTAVTTVVAAAKPAAAHLGTGAQEPEHAEIHRHQQQLSHTMAAVPSASPALLRGGSGNLAASPRSPQSSAKGIAAGGSSSRRSLMSPRSVAAKGSPATFPDERKTDHALLPFPAAVFSQQVTPLYTDTQPAAAGATVATGGEDGGPMYLAPKRSTKLPGQPSLVVEHPPPGSNGGARPRSSGPAPGVGATPVGPAPGPVAEATERSIIIHSTRGSVSGPPAALATAVMHPGDGTNLPTRVQAGTTALASGQGWECRYYVKTRFSSFLGLSFAGGPAFEAKNIVRALLGLR